jgi:hypothetical protein
VFFTVMERTQRLRSGAMPSAYTVRERTKDERLAKGPTHVALSSIVMRGWTVVALILAAFPLLQCSDVFRAGDGGGNSGVSGQGGDGAGGDAAEGGSDQGGSSDPGGTGGDAGSDNAAGAGHGAETGLAGAAGGEGTDDSVHGTVLHDFGGPLAGWSILVNGASATTNADGEFTVPDVAETYDLVVASGNDHRRLYHGLTRRDPVVVMTLIEGDLGWATNSANMSGTVTNITTGNEVMLDFWFGSKRAWITALPSAMSSAMFGPFTRTWNYAEDPIDVTLVGINLVTTGGTSWRVGTKSFSATAGGSVSGLEVALAAATSRTVTTTIEPESGVTLTAASHCLSGLCRAITVATSTVATLPLGLNDRDARIEVSGTHASGTSKTTAQVADGDNAATLPLTAPPALVSPAEGGNVTSSTSLTWQNYDNGIHVLSLTADGFLLEVYTDDSSFALSDLPDAAYESGSEYTWRVSGIGPADTVDDLVSGSSVLKTSGVEYLVQSAERTFTP